MVILRIIAIFEAVAGVMGLLNLYSGDLVDIPVLAGRPQLSIYIVFQLLGISAGVLLWYHLRRGLVLSAIYQALQILCVQTRTYALVLSTGLSLSFSGTWLSDPNDVSSQPSLVLGMNLLALVFALYLVGYYVWNFEDIIRRERESRAG